MKHLSKIIIIQILSIILILKPNLLITSDYAIKLNKINDGVWVYIPSKEQMENKIVVSNIGVIEGDNYSLIIDAGNSVSFANQFLKELKKIKIKPIKYLIITHRHYDHSFGLEAFAKEQTEVYMDKNEFQLLKSEGPLIKKMIFKESDIIEDIINFKNIANLKINYLADQKILDLGNRKVLIKNVGRAHTKGDIIIYDFKSKSYFVGDLVFSGRAAAFSDANVKLWLKKLDKIFNYSWNYMLPGHGKLLYKVQEINDTKYWLSFIDSSLARSIKQGDMISEILNYKYPDKINNLKFKDINFKRGIKKQFKLYIEKNYIE